MRSSRVVRASDCQCLSRIAVLGSISASSDTVESEGRQMKQCWIRYIEKKNKKCGKIVFVEEKRFFSAFFSFLLAVENGIFCKTFGIFCSIFQGGEEVFHSSQVHRQGLHPAVLLEYAWAVQWAGAGHRLAQPGRPATVLCRGHPPGGRAHWQPTQQCKFMVYGNNYTKSVLAYSSLKCNTNI